MTGVSGIGLGRQEQFYNCADITIGTDKPGGTTDSPPTTTTTKLPTSKLAKLTTTTTTTTTTTKSNGEKQKVWGQVKCCNI